jgi:hypothetical protein
MDAEELIRQAADSVRSALDAGQRRAEEIVAEAESQARRIRAEAEAAASRIRGEAEGQAERRLEEVRGALDELRGKLSDESGAPDTSAQAAPDGPPPAQAASESRPDSESGGDQAPTDGDPPSTDELMVQLKAGSDDQRPGSSAEDPRPSPGDRGSGGEGAARLVAMKLALDGTPREEVRARLAHDYEVDDLDALLDEVYAKAAG